MSESKAEACQRFADSSRMFIRGVSAADAERLWDHAERIGVPGWGALKIAIEEGETPDECIDRLGDKLRTGFADFDEYGNLCMWSLPNSAR